MRNLGDGAGNLPALSLPLGQPPTNLTPITSAGAPLADAPRSPTVADTVPNVEHLLCAFHDVRCAIALHELREVQPAVPAVVALPFSPTWLVGMFPWRTELAGLIDPVPMLLAAAPSQRSSDQSPAALTATLIAGEDDRLLGLAVTRLGGVAAITSGALSHIVPADAALAGSPFVRGWYTADPGAGGGSYAVLDLPAFLDACLAGLKDEAPGE